MKEKEGKETPTTKITRKIQTIFVMKIYKKLCCLKALVVVILRYRSTAKLWKTSTTNGEL